MKLTPDEKGVICGLMDLYKKHNSDNILTNNIINVVTKKFYNEKINYQKLTSDQIKFIIWLIETNQGNFRRIFVEDLCISILKKLKNNENRLSNNTSR